MQDNREVHQQLLMLKGLISDLSKEEHNIVSDVRNRVREVLESYPETECDKVFMGLAVEYIQYCLENAEELSL